MMGNVTSDPVLKAVGENSVCNFSLAVNRKSKSKTGAVIDETCFIEVNVWNKQAQLVKQYVSKGDPILVEGRLKQDNWLDKEGNKRSKHSIIADSVVFLGTKSSSTDQGIGDSNTAFLGDDIEAELNKVNPSPTIKAVAAFVDDLPF